MGDIKKSVRWIKKIAEDDSHGYDQAHRNSPDYDCSSLVATALNKGGFDISPKCYTGNLLHALTSVGFKSCKPPYKAGDVHLTPFKHTAMQINDKQIVQATNNELGGIVGGKTGDQTGKEIAVYNYYDFPWTYHLRYYEKTDSLTDVAMDVIRGKYGNGIARKKNLENAGYDYLSVQNKVNEIMRNLK